MNQFDLKITLQTIAAIFLAGVGAYFLHPYFQEWSFHLLKGVKIQAVQMETQSTLRILFVVAFAFVPILFFGVNKLLKVTESKQKILTISAILITGVIFWQFKISSLNARYEDLSKIKFIQYYFALEDLNLEMYLLLGFIIGAILGGIGLYRYQKRN